MRATAACKPETECHTGACAGDEPLEGNYFVSTYPPFSTWSASSVSETVKALSTAPASSANTPLGLYIHIPFCVKRCSYCYYLSYTGRSRRELDDYAGALIDELILYRQLPALADRDLSFIYFGGGTPSLLSEETLAKLLEEMQSVAPWSAVEEVTFECAPMAVSQSKMHMLRQHGVTRVSMGVQTFNDDVLRRNGRVHLARDVEEAYAALRNAAFPIINLDLIVGLVGESESSFFDSVDRAIALHPESVTIYQLEIPKNTPLSRDLRQPGSSIEILSWAQKRQRLGSAFERLEAAGYHVRSAYTAVRDPHRHRFVYQDEQYRGADLLGLGLASFSYIQGHHFQNVTREASYYERLRDGLLPIDRSYSLSDEERLIREFILQLKLGHVDICKLSAKFTVDVRRRFAQSIDHLERENLMTTDARGITLTRAGLLRADRLLPAFFRPCHRDIRYS